jgi:hypothetical protein
MFFPVSGYFPPMSWPTTTYDQQAECWWTTLPCEGCGGYRHDIHLSDPHKEEASQLLAQAALDHHNEYKCLNCLSSENRKVVPSDNEHSVLWWDAETSDWLVWLPVEGISEGVTLPLGIRFSTSGLEAGIAARCLMGNNPLLLHVLEEGISYDSDIHGLHRPVTKDNFMLWLPCDECSGVDIPLLTKQSSSLEAAAIEALECFSWLETDGCPQCNTHKFHRENKEDNSFRIWYDTVQQDWMFRIPDEDGETREFPLDINAYSASNEEVQTAADNLPYTM